MQRHPSVRAAISPVESARGRGGPQKEPIAEVDAAPKLGGAETSRSTGPASPDLGPSGSDLVTLQAERDVVSGAEPDVQGAGLDWEAGPTVGVSQTLIGGDTCGGVAGGDQLRNRKVWPGLGPGYLSLLAAGLWPE